jgi:type IV pilus assembly protein PilQ
MQAKLAWGLMALVALSGAAPAAVEERSTTAISEIRQESADRTTRLIVECTGPVSYTYYSPDPLTLVVDMPEVDPSKVPARINVGTREVEAVRVSAMARPDGRTLTRLEVRLASLAPYQIFSRDKSLNLVFERPAEGKTPEVRAEAAAEPAATAPAPAAPVAAAPVAAAAPAPAAEAAPVESGARWRPVSPQELAAIEKLEPAEAAAPAAAPEVPRPPATRILSVIRGEENGELVLTIRADGALKYQDFFLGNPDRLVVDFPDVLSKATVRSLEVNQAPVRRVRLAQFSAASPRVARLVLDLIARSPYRIVDVSDGLKILFGEGEPPSPAPLAALRTEPAPDPAASAMVMPASAQAPSVLPAPAPAPIPAPEPQQQSVLVEGPPTAAAASVPSGEKVYTGHPISLDFKDGDLQDIFRLFADISGLNVVVNPGVSGKVTLKLNEVPWDQALDLILKANGLGYTLEGNVIRIARLTDLAKEETERRKLAEEKALAGDLGTLTTRISYAKAGELSEVLKKAGALSPRGSINVDPRTNTMIINDLPAYLDRARALIADLDRATPQVEIEARIVVTTRNFTRDLGIQWGFLNQQTAKYGNTTNLSFPNAIIINGQATPSNQGIPATGVPGGLNTDAGIGTPGRGYLVNMPAAGFTSGIGISMGNIIGSFNLDVALTALERQGRGRLLSTPKVTTQNNQAAEIKQGVQIPIQTVANNTVTVTFKDAVLTLKVTPQITEAGTVILAVEVENNAADFANLVNGIPPINTQSAKTQVLVRDGSTAVIGGIYQSNEQTSQNSTPFLSKVPVIGYLFRSRFVTSTNNELLLFITPRIIRS